MSPGMRFNITIAPFKAQNPLISGFSTFLNVGYTKPIVEKFYPYFLKNANIMSPSSAKIIYLVTFLNCASAYASSCQHFVTSLPMTSAYPLYH